MTVADRYHVGYCTNVHPGEGLDALDGVIDQVAGVKARWRPTSPLGTGLRLGHAAVAALAADPGRRRALADRLQTAGLYAFTVNGFPYGDFAAPEVKAAVYRPSWLDRARVDYTLALAEVLAALPGPPERSLSTVGGCFRPDGDDDAAHAQMGIHFGEAARGLADLAQRTGISVRLCLEPEPLTTLETTDDVLAFFARLAPLGAVGRDHLGLCYDCCHQAVLFEDAAESLGRLVAAGVPIGKIQVSSALHLGAPANPEARAALLAFAEPRYFHQTVALTAGGTRLRCDDLAELAELDDSRADWQAAVAWRTHFHVPIWWGGAGHLGTTRADWQAAVQVAVELDCCRHFEVETYTWDVIPQAEREVMEGGDLQACVAAELQALARSLPS